MNNYFTGKYVLTAIAAALMTTASMSAATAQPKQTEDQACPVQMSNLNLHPSKLTFSYLNATGKEIAGIEFGAAYYDGVQEAHPVVVTGEWKGMKSGYQRDSGLDISYWKTANLAGWTVWPAKILYKDGSQQELSMEHASCGMELRHDGTQHSSYVPAPVVKSQPAGITLASN